MTVTMKQVRQHLDPEEPNYPEAAKLGSEAIPHLEALVRSAEPMLASKATFLASMILSEGSEQVVRTAAQSPEPIVRVAAAAAVRNLHTEAAARLMPLLGNDTDEGVRKVAARALIDDDENTLVPAAKTKARRGKEFASAGAVTGEGGGSSDNLGGSAARAAAVSQNTENLGDGGGSISPESDRSSMSFAPSATDGQGSGGGSTGAAAASTSASTQGDGGGSDHAGHAHSMELVANQTPAENDSPPLFGGGRF